MAEVLVDEGEGETPANGFEPKTFDQPTVETVGGALIPALGFGTFELDDDDAYRMVRAALDDGIRHIDTAQMYQNEGAVGSAIHDSDLDRDDIFLTTKLNNDQHEPGRVAASLKESLDKLKTDYVDLFLVHWPVEWDRMGATMATLTQAHGAGLTRHLGVSNFTIPQLEEVQQYAPLEVLQVECHPFFPQAELRQWTQAAGWAFTAYSPLAQGKAIGNDTLDEIGAAHGVGGPAVALAWLMTLPQANVIPRTSSEEHLHANNQARSLELTEEEIARVAALDNGKRLIDPDFAPW